MPYHAHVPRPYLRLYFVCYLYAALAALTLALDRLAARACPLAAATAATVAAPDGIPRVYVRTDVYASEQDARDQTNPISSPNIASVPLPKSAEGKKKK